MYVACKVLIADKEERRQRERRESCSEFRIMPQHAVHPPPLRNPHAKMDIKMQATIIARGMRRNNQP
jgi:hypothetical protein